MPRRKSNYGSFIHRLGKTVNGVAREIEVTGRSLRQFIRVEPKRFSEPRIDRLAAALDLTRPELDAKLKEWRQ